jgi:hypothetical protein
MPTSEKPQTKKTQETNIIHYLGIIICAMLAVLGGYQIITNRIEDGIINIIIGTSLSFSFIPFDYNKAEKWQKVLIVIYGLLLFVGTAYLLFKGFTN